MCVYRNTFYTNAMFNIFYDTMETVLSTLMRLKERKIIICGDFNINTLEQDRQTRRFEQFLLNYNLKLQLHTPTRLVSQTCIDNFILDSRKKCECKILDLGLSDHTAQILKYPVKKFSTMRSWKIKCRDYSKPNLDKFVACLKILSFLKFMKYVILTYVMINF